MMRWDVRALACNDDGPFDAAYSFGNPHDEGGMDAATADEIGAGVARFLKGLTRDDVEAMKYGTGGFHVRLFISLSEGGE